MGRQNLRLGRTGCLKKLGSLVCKCLDPNWKQWFISFFLEVHSSLLLYWTRPGSKPTVLFGCNAMVIWKCLKEVAQTLTIKLDLAWQQCLRMRWNICVKVSDQKLKFQVDHHHILQTSLNRNLSGKECRFWTPNTMYKHQKKTPYFEE